MKKSRFTAEQIVSILNEAGQKETKLAEICRKHGITEQTYYRWRRAYGGLQSTGRSDCAPSKTRIGD